MTKASPSKEGGFSSAYQKVVKTATFGGAILPIFLASSALTVITANPAAGLLSVLGNFYGGIFNTAVNSLVPGSMCFLQATFNSAAGLMAPTAATGVALSALSPS